MCFEAVKKCVAYLTEAGLAVSSWTVWMDSTTVAPSRLTQTQRAQVSVAAQNHTVCATAVPRHSLLARTVKPQASFDAVPARTIGFIRVDVRPHEQDDEDKSSTLPSSGCDASDCPFP